MKHKFIITSLAFSLLCIGGLHAQEGLTASGGEATGTGGTVSYSIGQVAYITNTGANGSVAQGIQQPYEIFVTVGLEETAIDLELSVYPNPTYDYLTLKTEGNDKMAYQLYDVQGKLIDSQEVTSDNTIITVVALTKATYFLKVTKNNQIVKTFKVVKN